MAAKPPTTPSQPTVGVAAATDAGEDGMDAKAWKDIWGCGQGIGAVKDILPVAELVARLQQEYTAARERLLAA